ncbi:type VII secretion target [Actinokineospora guangxiensis]|uniref:Type VII secretion target n=1 Tax=Actinokineospora guangxiensis TaxID=1490288 RepID=A0ABW0EU01_9PSEU
MGDGFTVNAEQIRAHAGNVAAVQERFSAVKSASSHIQGDGQAYGVLCGWIAAILEDKHTRQDELIAGAERNLRVVEAELRSSAEEYEVSDQTNAEAITTSGGEPR